MSFNTVSPKLQAQKAIKDAWALFKDNLGTILTLMLVGLILVLIWSAFWYGIWSLFPHHIQSNALFHLIFQTLVTTFSVLASANVSLKLAKGEAVSVKDIYDRWDIFPEMFTATFLYTLILPIAFLFLIVPGFIVGARWFLYDFVIIDQGLSPLKALEKSWHLVTGSTWSMIGLLFMTFGLLLLGALALGIGLFFTYPITALARAMAYRQLTNVASQTEPITIDVTPVS
jgi:hypothetical protein